MGFYIQHIYIYTIQTIYRYIFGKNWDFEVKNWYIPCVFQEIEQELNAETEQIMNELRVEINLSQNDQERTCYSWFRTLFMSSKHLSHRSVEIQDLDSNIATPKDRASRIDLHCRKLFPLVFGILTFFYWILYTYLIEDQSYRAVIQTEQDSYYHSDITVDQL